MSTCIKSNFIKNKAAHGLVFFSRHAAISFFIFSTLFSFITYYILTKVPDPPGVNGYFYLKQIWALGEKSTFYFRDYSLSFLIPTILYKTGLHELMSFRISIALFMGVFFFNSAYLIYQFNKYLIPCLLFAIIACGFNISLFEISFSYFKNFASLTLFLGAINAWVLFDKTRSQKWLFLSAVLLITSLLCHKSAFLLTACFLLSIVLTNFKWKWLLWAGGLALISPLIFSMIFSSGFQYLVFISHSFAHSPYDYIKWQMELLTKSQNFAPFGLIYITVSCFFLFLQKQKLPTRARQLHLFLLIFCCLSWLPFHEASEDGISYRLILMAVALSLPIYFALLTNKNQYSIAAICLSLFVGCQFVLSRGLVHQFTFYSELHKPISQITKWVSQEDHLTCPHGLEFYVDYVTNIRCRIYPLKNSDKNTFRIAFAPPGLNWMMTRQRAHLYGLHKIGTSFFLLTEEKWQEIYNKYSPPKTWQNKMTYRPAHVYDHP